MEIKDILSIAAIVGSAILAVIITKYIDTRNNIKNEKIQLFKILASHSYNSIASEKVRAMNLVEIVFYNSKKVIEAYQKLRTALRQNDVIAVDIRDAYIKVLEEMAKDLNYNEISWDNLKNHYLPDGIYNEMESEKVYKDLQLKILQQQFDLNEGEKARKYREIQYKIAELQLASLEDDKRKREEV